MHSLLYQELARARQAEILASHSHHGRVRAGSPEPRQPHRVMSRLRTLRAALART